MRFLCSQRNPLFFSLLVFYSQISSALRFYTCTNMNFPGRCISQKDKAEHTTANSGNNKLHVSLTLAVARSSLTCFVQLTNEASACVIVGPEDPVRTKAGALLSALAVSCYGEYRCSREGALPRQQELGLNYTDQYVFAELCVNVFVLVVSVVAGKGGTQDCVSHVSA